MDAIKFAVELDEKGHGDRGIQELLVLVTQYPKLAIVHSYLAWLLSHRGQFNPAIEHAREAVSIAPCSEKASLVLFHTLWRAGEREPALEEAKRFVANAPSKDYEAIIKALELKTNEGRASTDSDLPEIGL